MSLLLTSGSLHSNTWYARKSLFMKTSTLKLVLEQHRLCEWWNGGHQKTVKKSPAYRIESPLQFTVQYWFSAWMRVCWILDIFVGLASCFCCEVYSDGSLVTSLPGALLMSWSRMLPRQAVRLTQFETVFTIRVLDSRDWKSSIARHNLAV